jgi:hypothetical protein
MAIEISREGYLTKRAWRGCNPTRPIVSHPNREERGSTCQPSRGAIALGVLLAIGTLVVLFWDVRGVHRHRAILIAVGAPEACVRGNRLGCLVLRPSPPTT